MSRKYQNSKDDLPSFAVIEAASESDVEAINAILKHYEGEITGRSIRIMFDECGNPHWFIDETLRRRLETKLITRILKFDTTPRQKKNTANAKAVVK
ncbi:MAG: helix-turn-helix domain-containing protein [Clostridiales bacterium]|nr:helix-turn-helix domain-containing protein [Clostridiales bacterium]